MFFTGKTVLITGASRGIGKAIGLRLAGEKSNIIVVAKSVEENPKLGGTIYSSAKDMESAGGKALAIQCDIRYEDQVQRMVKTAVGEFGAIDILINNASAISLSDTERTEVKRFDLMHDINVRGTFLVTQACLPFLRKSPNPHILTLSPPLNMDLKWFAPHVAYTISKYAMSMMTLGWAAEFGKDGIAANSLWPRTTIATAAVRNLLGGEELVNRSRTPAILADAAYHILKQPSKSCTGNLFVDENVLAKEGIIDLDHYSVNPGTKLFNDLFI